MDAYGFLHWGTLAKPNVECMVFLVSPTEARLIDPKHPDKVLMNDDTASSGGDIPFEAPSHAPPETVEEQGPDTIKDPGTLSAETTALSDTEIRDLMKKLSKDERRNCKSIFNVKTVHGNVLPPHYSIALATDEQENRFLSDEKLDEILPFWKKLLVGTKSLPSKDPQAKRIWRDWRKNESKKLKLLGRPWPLEYKTEKTAKWDTDNRNTPSRHLSHHRYTLD